MSLTPRKRKDLQNLFDPLLLTVNSVTCFKPRLQRLIYSLNQSPFLFLFVFDRFRLSKEISEAMIKECLHVCGLKFSHDSCYDGVIFANQVGPPFSKFRDRSDSGFIHIVVKLVQAMSPKSY